MSTQKKDADSSGNGNYIKGNVTAVSTNGQRQGVPNLTVTAGSYNGTTDANGNYSISNVAAGTYTVSVTYNNIEKEYPNVVVTNQRGANNINFPY